MIIKVLYLIKTYYFDDVQFGQPVLGGLSNHLSNLDIQVFPNPTSDSWTIMANDQTIQEVILYDLMGNQLSAYTPNDNQVLIKTNGLSKGTYFALITTNLQKQILPFVKK